MDKKFFALKMSNLKIKWSIVILYKIYLLNKYFFRLKQKLLHPGDKEPSCHSFVGSRVKWTF